MSTSNNIADVDLVGPDIPDGAETPTALTYLPSDDDGGSPLPVPISYEIIQLFSEGLYQSPQKAIEELVANGFDAGAKNVRVVLPSSDSKETLGRESLFVVDDGFGMDDAGFTNLWAVARSSKKDVRELHGRKPIGQFGIGKLAAFVLAWRLTHVSKSNGVIRVVSMDFHRVSGVHQWDNSEPIQLKMHDIDVDTCKQIMSELEDRDPDAWRLLFSSQAPESWTVAILSDFKNLFDKLSTGRLNWVLRTGLPIFTNFSVYVDNQKLVSSKEEKTPIFSTSVGGSDDAAGKLDIDVKPDGIEIPGINGVISGEARLYEQPLSKGKSEATGRSHGFFVVVRGRIINLEDELFGLSALSHGAWARFYMRLEVDGLHSHLLSSREGVKDSIAVRTLRKYMHEKFNECRSFWNDHQDSEITSLSLAGIRGDASGRHVSGPLMDAVRKIADSPGYDPFYLQVPVKNGDDGEGAGFSDSFAAQAEKHPISSAKASSSGNHAPLASYNIADLNRHPLGHKH